MNTRLLKKIRKRYQWYWDSNNKQFVVMDHKAKYVRIHKKVSNFIAHWICDHLGSGSHISYCKRIEKRENLFYYKKALDKGKAVLKQLA
jgi:hypothetical protein